MAIVDGKGRLFGKINLLDLVVVLAVVAVAGRFGYQQYRAGQIAPTGEDKVIEMTFVLPTVEQFTIDALQEGEEVYDSKSNAYMGKVVRFEKRPAVVVREGPDGRMYEAESQYKFDYYVTIAGPGRVSPNGVTMGGIEVKVGRQNQFKSAFWAGQGTTVAFPNLDLSK